MPELGFGRQMAHPKRLGMLSRQPLLDLAILARCRPGPIAQQTPEHRIKVRRLATQTVDGFRRMIPIPLGGGQLSFFGFRQCLLLLAAAQLINLLPRRERESR